MAGIFALEIDGWGEVGNALAITNAEGFADGTFVLTTADTPPTSGEFGAMMWAEDVSVVADGYYTLIARTAATVTLQASSPTVTSTAVTGLARIEDHFRLADGVPSWVTGSDAAARWLPGVQGVTESAGQRIDPLGGLASVDGIEVVHNRVRHASGLSAVRAPTFRESAVGPVTLVAALDGSATTCTTVAAAIYSGEGTAVPTASAGPSWIGSEAVDCRATASMAVGSYPGAWEYLQTVTRGVLRTPARPHAEGVVVYGRLPAAVGRVARVFVYDEGHASHVDRTERFVGIIEGSPIEEAGKLQRLRLASTMLQPRVAAPELARGSAVRSGGPGGTWAGGPLTVRTATGSHWRNALVGKGAISMARLTSAPESVTADGVELWEYYGPLVVDDWDDFPLVERAESDDEWGSYTFPWPFELTDVDRPARKLWDIGGTFVVAWNADPMPLAHVFEPEGWARARNGTEWNFSGGRRVEVNPVDVILQILVSTGTTSLNGTYDKAPAAFGLGIDEGHLDLDTFTDIGDRIELEGITAGTVSLIADAEHDLAEFLDKILRAYCLALGTTTTGTLRLIDMSRAATSATTPTLTESDLVAPGKGRPVRVAEDIAAANAIEAVTLSYDRPWRRPSDPQSRVIDRYEAEVGGVQELFGRVGAQKVGIELPFAATLDEIGSHALAGRWGRLLGLHQGLVGTLTVDVHSTWDGEIGDIVLATFDQLPDASGQSGMADAVLRVIDRVQTIRPIGEYVSDSVTLLVYGYTDTDRRVRAWCPSGLVTAVVDSLNFTLKADQYHGADYTSDADSFADDHVVALYEADWTLRGAGGVVDSTTGNDVVLSTSCGGITPNIGDKLTLDEESAQTEATTGWMWLTTDAPGYRWQ